MNETKAPMKDRVQVVIALPKDVALPIDVQGVALRRRAIDLMQDIAAVDENTVRYSGASEDCHTDFGPSVGTLSMWQSDLRVFRFIADGKAQPGVCGPVYHGDSLTRCYSATSLVRNEFA